MKKASAKREGVNLALDADADQAFNVAG